MCDISLVADIIESYHHSSRMAVVVSAIGGVTNKLITRDFKEVVSIHSECLLALKKVTKITLDQYSLLEEMIRTDIGLIENESDEDIVMGYGEIWSSKILVEVLKKKLKNISWKNARDIIHLLEGSEVRVDWKKSRLDLTDEGIYVITGFLASDHMGMPTTLKRNGSDHSGAIVANLVNAELLTIWTDVDGIFSADPRVVQSAIRIEKMSYKETAELAYFGAKVIHPQTMAPCVKKAIPIVLRNTFNLDCEGTFIGNISPSTPARGVTSIPLVAIINIEGSGLFGFSGIAAKLFGAVSAANVNIIMITQASSEYSICFAVPMVDGKKCVLAIENVFQSEIKDAALEISLQPASIVAAVGEGMHAQQGLLGLLATALGNAHVNVIAIAQGSSERNVTFVVKPEDGISALQALHSVLINK